MNKHQLACQAVLSWDEVATESKKRMLAPLNNNSVNTSFEKKGSTASILAKRFGVSKGYVGEARKLFLEDREFFNLVLAGEEFLPVVRSKKKNKGAESFALYRAYNSEGILIYIGKTWNVGQRMASHAGGSEWWDEAINITIERSFDSYEDLTAAETLAIRKEQPKHNLKAKWYS